MTNTTNLEEFITIDYAGFHGPVGSALVTDDETPFDWYEDVVIMGHNECESDWHDGDCDCPTDDYYREVYLSNITRRGMRLVTESEEL
jgi:hypothetical protein